MHKLLAAMMLSFSFGAECSEPQLPQDALLSAKDKPNIIVFLVDDMGWMDSGIYGSKYYETPNIDRFARQSMLFTDAYAHALCSPSRASILSGQEEGRHGILAAVGHLDPDVTIPTYDTALDMMPYLQPGSRRFLPHSIVTLADVMKAVGYKTAFLGKWHLGAIQEHWPDKYGFDVTFNFSPDPGPPGSSYFAPHKIHQDGVPSTRHSVANFENGPDGEHITDRLTDEAITFIKANRDRPFFLYLSHYSVHGPWQAKQKDIEHFVGKVDPTGRQGNPVYAGMLKVVDESLGKLIAALDELHLADNTIIIFFSDNGGNDHSWGSADQNKLLANEKHPFYDMIKTYNQYAGAQPPTNNAPLREGKGRIREGGIRVPLIVRWPGKIPANKKNGSIINNTDLYPTILELAGIDKPQNHIIDGTSFAPVLLNESTHTNDISITWLPREGISCRKGDWKLIRRFKPKKALARKNEGSIELYNLKTDPGETHNLAKENRLKVTELNQLIIDYFNETGSPYPKANLKHVTKN